MKNEFSSKLRKVIKSAGELAKSVKCSQVRVEHILYFIITDTEIYQDASFGVEDFNELKEYINKTTDNVNENLVGLDGPVELILQRSKKIDGDVVTINDFLKQLIETNKYQQVIPEPINDIYEKIKTSVINKSIEDNKMGIEFNLMDENDGGFSEYPEKKNTNKKVNKKKDVRTPTLDQFSRDLTEKSNEGLIDPVIGRTNEIERVAQILSRRKKNNPIIVGNAGVGKSAIAEGLANLINSEDCPPSLKEKRLVSLDLTAMVAGTKYRGEFEQRIKRVIDEISDRDDIILFVDELHTLIGAGSASGSMDAANIFKPALANGEVQMIGATTLDEYREHIEKDAALVRRFQKIIVEEPTENETIEILSKIKNKYEDYHGVTFNDDSIEHIVYLAKRYITDRSFPDKALDILDECGSRMKINIKTPEKIIELETIINEKQKEKLKAVKGEHFKEAATLRDEIYDLQDKLKQTWAEFNDSNTKKRLVIDKSFVNEVVSKLINVPINDLDESEFDKISNIEKTLSNSVIGQDVAIELVAKSIKRNRIGIKKGDKPNSFLFVGPTGVGKSQLAKELANKIFGDPNALIRIDMGEFTEKTTVSKLIGTTAGYIGYEEGGNLTEKVKNKPYSVVLLDEIEKAHPEVYNVLLTLLDEGYINDGHGKKINFKNTIVILTSNIGIKKAINNKGTLGFRKEDETEKRNSILDKELKEHFNPEFINRLDEIVYFNSLNKEDISKIVDIKLNELNDHLKMNGWELSLSSSAKEYLSEISYSEDYGAREVNRVIEKRIEDLISEELIKCGLPQQAKIKIGKKGDKFTIKIK